MGFFFYVYCWPCSAEKGQLTHYKSAAPHGVGGEHRPLCLTAEQAAGAPSGSDRQAGRSSAGTRGVQRARQSDGLAEMGDPEADSQAAPCRGSEASTVQEQLRSGLGQPQPWRWPRGLRAAGESARSQEGESGAASGTVAVLDKERNQQGWAQKETPRGHGPLAWGPARRRNPPKATHRQLTGLSPMRDARMPPWDTGMGDTALAVTHRRHTA